MKGFRHLNGHLPFMSYGGKRIVNVVPFPSWLSKETVPPNDSVIRLITAKPKP
jgi:hypothetical protein